jgi:hypothetical protein
MIVVFKTGRSLKVGANRDLQNCRLTVREQQLKTAVGI